MRSSIRLFQACRITLFTRTNCSLCTEAKHSLSTVWEARPFRYVEVDVMEPDQTKWRNLYEFDTPVIHIKGVDEEELPEMAGKAVKLMHRFTLKEVLEKMDLVKGREK